MKLTGHNVTMMVSGKEIIGLKSFSFGNKCTEPIAFCGTFPMVSGSKYKKGDDVTFYVEGVAKDMVVDEIKDIIEDGKEKTQIRLIENTVTE